MANVQRHDNGAKDREILYAVGVRSRAALMPIRFLDRIGAEAADLPASGQNEAPAIDADRDHQQEQSPTCKSQEHPRWNGHEFFSERRLMDEKRDGIDHQAVA
jgi:hypothetical protein